jgi:hypothetical protein
MAWIKRNLFFTIGGVIALLLLGAAGYYGYKSWSHNRDEMQAVTDAYAQLAQDYNSTPSPGNDQINNIEASQEQTKELENWIEEAKQHFKAVTPIPDPSVGALTDQAFAGTLRKTIQDMQQDATNSNVDLPPDYAFSFIAERDKVTFSPGSLVPLSTHLGEVKAICEVLFSAKINALVQIQREIVSDNDSTGPQSDYISDKATTVSLGRMGQATITPYTITFKCFSGDLGKVLASMASSDYCFIVKGINVIPAGETQTMDQTGAPQPMPIPTGGGLQTVLDEKLLQVTLAIEVVKLSS